MPGEPLTNEIIYKLTDEQRAILGELAEIAARELALTQQINEVAQQVRQTHQALGFEPKSA